MRWRYRPCVAPSLAGGAQYPRHTCHVPLAPHNVPLYYSLGALEPEPLLELLAERARLEGGAACLEAMERARPRGPHLVGQSVLLRLQLQRMRTPPHALTEAEGAAAGAAAASAALGAARGALEAWYHATGALLMVRSRASRESAVQLQWLHLRRQARCALSLPPSASPRTSPQSPPPSLRSPGGTAVS